MKTITENEAEEMFNQFLDEIYPEINIGVTFSPSRVLKELDPIAYQCGLNDWLDSENLEVE